MTMDDAVAVASRPDRPTHDRIVLGERIEAVRAGKAMSLHELSERVKANGSGLTMDDLRVIELGIREPDDAELSDIADALEVEADYLADIDGEWPSVPDVPDGVWVSAINGCWKAWTEDGATQATVVRMPNGYLWSVADAYQWTGIACGITPTHSQAINRCNRILFGD